jgi:hypothetical protein
MSDIDTSQHTLFCILLYFSLLGLGGYAGAQNYVCHIDDNDRTRAPL